eukprot:gnl/TRDRNA2_/TRDRNA2_149421_c1_seq1.p1 gnl/TRDRNA2_/TRDRNA2_149421_c1~~gnl/TRDRNA2_/TRDRNA2_149421_c1_seq1.p1  ORF type:complete len:422 (-),score=76.38 gnl/TRDRNA2_/TRDRNA2_149421_c1_seq1:20-1285(-)
MGEELSAEVDIPSPCLQPQPAEEGDSELYYDPLSDYESQEASPETPSSIPAQQQPDAASCSDLDPVTPPLRPAAYPSETPSPPQEEAELLMLQRPPAGTPSWQPSSSPVRLPRPRSRGGGTRSGKRVAPEGVKIADKAANKVSGTLPQKKSVFPALAFVGEWEDSVGHKVSVTSENPSTLSLRAHVYWDGNAKWNAYLKIRSDGAGGWTCGNAVLDSTDSSPSRVVWRTHTGQVTEWARKSAVVDWAMHGKTSEVPPRITQSLPATPLQQMHSPVMPLFSPSVPTKDVKEDQLLSHSMKCAGAPRRRSSSSPGPAPVCHTDIKALYAEIAQLIVKNVDEAHRALTEAEKVAVPCAEATTDDEDTEATDVGNAGSRHSSPAPAGQSGAEWLDRAAAVQESSTSSEESSAGPEKWNRSAPRFQ